MSASAGLGSLVLAWLLGVGPVAVIVALLNRRDRRARELVGRVAGVLPAEMLRSDAAVAVRCRLLGRRAAVRVDLRGAPGACVWDTAVRLRRGLPGWVTLSVEGRLTEPATPAAPVRVTLESAGSASLRPAA